MAQCNNCGNEAFETISDNGVVINTVVSDELGIKQGDTLGSVIFKLATALEGLLAAKENVSSEADIGKITTNAPSTTKSEKTFTLGVNPSTSKTDVSYDITEAIGGAKITSFVKVEAFGNSGGKAARVHQSTARAATFSAAPENFPLTLTIEANTVESDGQTVHKFTKTISNVAATTDEYLNVTDLSTNAIVDQKDVNEHLDGEIGSILNRLKAGGI